MMQRAARTLSDLLAKTKDIDQCLGIFYWEPQAYSGWNAYTLGAFDNTGKPTVALDAFKEIASLVNNE
ncbi:MAG: hypothetical protein R2738_05000 [Bacteroides graminisolvens]